MVHLRSYVLTTHFSVHVSVGATKQGREEEEAAELATIIIFPLSVQSQNRFPSLGTLKENVHTEVPAGVTPFSEGIFNSTHT